MGQSVSLTALSAGSAGINVKELEDLSYEKSLGVARFMKCIRARHRHGLVVVKVAMRPFPEFKLGPYIQALRRERDLLADVPNALGYQRILETEASGYLVRQYLHSSLYDRISTRPFLEDIEKKWLAYQLLCALRDCHARDVYHGDIKTENILVTSWNWLYLTDFSSSFKKTYLPEDNPADFSYFFDTSGRRTCYLAPERFLGAGEKGDQRGVTWAMDVFSVGCVIAELFLEAPIFSLSQLFKYRQGEYNPEVDHLSKIEDKDIRELVVHMIQVEPESRYSAEEYLNFWRRKAFPEYFYSFLHQYMGLITDPSSGRAPVLPETANFGEADDRIDRVYYDFDKISYFLGYGNQKSSHSDPEPQAEQTGEVLPVQIDIPDYRHQATSTGRLPGDDGTLIFLTLVVAALRNTSRANARIRACDLLLAFAERITDEAKLDRVLPYLVVLLGDQSDVVKIAALRSVTQLLALVEVVSPVNAYVFTEYVRPRLQHMVQGIGSKTKPSVRATYASCLASLAHSSSRILDLVQALRADGSIPTVDPETDDGGVSDSTYKTLYDVARYDLVQHFEAHTKALLTDSDASVRRAFLGSVSSLCIFFGSTKANDVVLSHLNTYLNDKDWMLKCAFFQTIVGVATFVGSSSLEDFILPLMVQALTDPEEFVVEKVLSSFASMAELGLFQRSKTWEMVDVVARFMMHPNIWIREASAHFISAATHFLSPADTQCIILPLIQPYIKVPITDLSETVLLDALKKPLPRPVFELAITWALRYERGIFWKQYPEHRTFSFGAQDQALSTISSKELLPNALKKIPKNDEDEQWLNRLRNMGLAVDDEFKLLSLRDYIYRTALKRPKNGQGDAYLRLNNIVKLKELNVTPQTVFFEDNKKQAKGNRRFSMGDLHSNKLTKKPHTIADALLDASTSIDDSLIQQRKYNYNGRKPSTITSSKTLPLPAGFHEPRGSSSALPSPISSSPTTRTSSLDKASPGMGPPRKPLSHAQTQLSTAGDARSDGTITPTDSLRKFSGQNRLKAGIRHKSSAISLLNGRETPKTLAPASTDATNAAGTMDSPFNQDAMDDLHQASEHHTERRADPTVTIGPGHTYDGNDPSVMRTLDGLASENYPVDVVDFGPLVTPIGRKALKKSDNLEVDAPWRPQGIHIATFGEHESSINRVLPAPDHTFFITASDDGSVKVWDTLRLERNLIHRSRQTHKHADGAQVKCVAFVTNTHTFVSCATDGSVHVVKVDCTHIGDTTKYGRLRLKRDYHLPEGEHAVWCEHYKAEGKSTLILATNLARILAIDLRTMSLLYTFTNPSHHGTPTTFCIDPKHTWLLLGTSHGVLALWDLRFQLRIKSWGIPGGTPIHRLQIHPWKGRGRWICIAGGTGQSEITLWDIERAQCREVFRSSDSSSSSSGTSKEELKAYEARNIDDENPDVTLARFVSAVPGFDPTANTSFIDHSYRAMTMGIDAPDDGREAKYGFFLSGGPDRKVRFWDLARVEASVVVSGLAVDEAQPRYVASHPTTSLIVNVEKGAKSAEGKVSAPSSKKGRGPRSAVMIREQQVLLRSHLDVITDVAVLERPVGMTVSVDRMGCVYVFQ